MTDTVEYAMMAGRVYQSTRTTINFLPDLESKGWSEFFHVADTSNPAFPTTSGFEATSFIKGNDEIVISYAGTYPADLTGDWEANLGLGIGVGSIQLLQAAQYYLQVKAENPNAQVTFTGHSLGGGLASLMAVFFNATAVTFDQAPFRNSANAAVAQSLRSELTTMFPETSYPLAATLLAPLNRFISSFDPLGLGWSQDGLATREANVSNFNVRGEFLTVQPLLSRIGNQQTTLDHGTSDLTLSAQLHSQALMTAFLQSDESKQSGVVTSSLRDVSFKLPDLIRLIFDDKLYSVDTKGDKENFIERLVRHQNGIAGLTEGEALIAADAMLTRFTADLWKLAKDNGLTLTDGNTGFLSSATNNISKALTAFAMQMYYEDTANAVNREKQLFTEVTGGIQFDITDVSKTFQPNSKLDLKSAKGFDLYFKNYLASSNFTGSERQFIESVLPYMRDWYVQAGSNGLAYTDIQNRGAFMLGGNASDALVGGTGADLLVGNAGDDLLMGGKGNDTLIGGKDNDTYIFQTADGRDTILDNDGQGSIAYDGDILTGGAQHGDNRVYRSADKKHLYVLANDNTLLIDGQIVVNAYNKTRGDLGLTYTDAPAPSNPATTRDIKGDLKPLDTNLVADGIQTTLDDIGNIVASTEVDPEKADTLQDSADNDHITSGGGNDNIYTTRGGDNWLEAGAGRDWVRGGAGIDLVEGGAADADILQGGGGDDRLYADSQTTVAQAISDGDSQTGTGQQGDWLAGNAGDDMLVGGVGNDALSGGAGADLLLGGAGDDYFFGDPDLIPVSLNWSETNNSGGAVNFDLVVGEIHPADYGADVVYAGAGDDTAFGGRGNDVLFGEADNDDLVGNGDNDALFGGTGNDRLYGDGHEFIGEAETNMGDDYLDGGVGDDKLYGGAGSDILIGGTGDDMLEGGEGQDIYVFTQGDGTDTIIDNLADNNIIRFGEGVQSSDITLRLGSLMLDMGNGDALHIENFNRDDVYNSVGIGSFEFADGSALNTTELLARGFDLGGTAQDDVILGTNITDRMQGFAGNDVLNGGEGDDILYGGSGDDTLIGGAGADLMDGGEGNDSYQAGAGDIITDGSGHNAVTTVDGAVYTASANGADLVMNLNYEEKVVVVDALRGSIDSVGGTNLSEWLKDRLTDSVTVTTTKVHQTLYGGSGNDHLTALHTDATLLGGAGRDTLTGGVGHDTLRGGAGDDVIDGGDGDDVLCADQGLDTLRGGAGMDTYMLGLEMNQVTVTDDSQEGSVIQLAGQGMSLDSLRAQRSQNDLLLEVRGTSTNMRIKDYYSPTQTSWTIKDAQGQSLSVQAVIDASKPKWDNLRNSLLQEFRLDTLGRINQSYFEQGYAQQADGSWFQSSLYLPLSNYSQQVTTTFYKTHYQLESPFGVWGTGTTTTTDIQWTTSQWESNLYFYPNYDVSVGFSNLVQAASDDVITLSSLTRSTSSQAAWVSVQWDAWYQVQSLSESTSYSFVDAQPGQPAEVISLQSRTITSESWYGSSSKALTFQDPGANAVKGGLPQYVSVAYTHNYANYNLGETVLSDGNHTVTANRDSAVIGGVGNNTIYDAGFAYGGTGNARLIGGDTLMAGTGDQYLGYGKTMVVGDGHDTVVGAAGSRTLVNPNNTGIDLLASGDGSVDVVGSIYAGRGVRNLWESYQQGGRFFLATDYGEGGLEGEYFDSVADARIRYNNHPFLSFEDALHYVQPLPALLTSPNLNLDIQQLGQPSAYYITHPLQTVVLTANNFTALQPYFDAGLLPMKTVSFGVGLSFSDITLTWGQALSPMDGSVRATLDLQWGNDQGIRVMIPRTDDPLDSMVSQFEFADGQMMSMGALIALAPPAPHFDFSDAQLYAGMGHQLAVAGMTTGIYAGAVVEADVSVQEVGADLVISMNGGQDSLRLMGWYSNPVTRAFTMKLVFADGTVWQQEDLESMVLTKITGTAGNDVLTGTAANELINGVAGADSMTGGKGNDTYVVDVAADVVIEKANEGTDTVRSGISYKLGNNVENLVLTGTAAINATGNSLNNVLIGNAANNTLNGGVGADTMQGRAGDDTYYIDNIGDIVLEAQAEGTDRVIASINYTLGNNVEDLQISGTADISATGNDLDNKITGNSGANTLLGGAGDDRLTGGLGADLMLGGTGDDLYEVENVGDRVVEDWDEGVDTVEASVAYSLSYTIENLILTGTLAIDGTGSALDNTLQGNDAANVLTGGDGNDTLNGKKGLDTLMGGLGNDTYLLEDDVDTVIELADEGRDNVISRYALTLAENIEDGMLLGSAASITGNALSNVLTGSTAANTIDGGAGADVMLGGKGNDTYIVDTQADTVIENAAEGTDTVQSSVNYTLADNLENLILTGTAEAGMGNSLNNKLTGNAASNKLFGGLGNDDLDGGAGADILIGGLGNDEYWLDSSSDLVVEAAGEGTDIVYASVSHALADNVERLVLTGSADINAVGNAGNNRLEGNAGNNILFGGLGNDTYVFGRGSGHDIVANFDAGKPSGDLVQLGAGIVDADLTYVRAGNDLVLSINDSNDQLTVAGYFENGGKGANALEKIRFADGTSLNHAAVLSRTSVSGGISEAQSLPAGVSTGNPAALFDAPDPEATKTSDATLTPQSVAESINAARERFEQGLNNLKSGTQEEGGLSRIEFAERRAMPLLWNLQDALLNLQLAKNADGRFTADISMDSRATRDLGLGINLLGAVTGTSGRLDQIARPSEIQQFDLAQLI